MLATNKEFLKLQKERMGVFEQQKELRTKERSLEERVRKLFDEEAIPAGKLKRGDVFIQQGRQTWWYDEKEWDTCYGIDGYLEEIWYSCTEDCKDLYEFSSNSKVFVMKHTDLPEHSLFDEHMTELKKQKVKKEITFKEKYGAIDRKICKVFEDDYEDVEEAEKKPVSDFNWKIVEGEYTILLSGAGDIIIFKNEKIVLYAAIYELHNANIKKTEDKISIELIGHEEHVSIDLATLEIYRQYTR